MIGHPQSSPTRRLRYSLKDYLSLRRDQDKGLSRGAVKNISKVPKWHQHPRGKMWVDFFLAGVPPCTCTYDIWQSMGCIRHIMGEDFGHIGAIHQNLLFCFFFQWKMWSQFPICPIYFRPFVGVPCPSIYIIMLVGTHFVFYWFQSKNLVWVACFRVVA